MSFCASDWEVHGFSGAFPSNCKTKPNFSIEAPFVPDDVFEELYWEDGQLRVHQKQLSSWAANSPVQATRDHGVAPLHVGGYAASLNINVDATQYPPDVEKMYNKNSAVSYLPSLSLEKSDGAPYRGYALTGALDRERHSMRNDNGSQQGSFTCTHGSASNSQSPEPKVSLNAASSFPHFDPYTYNQSSLQSLARLAAEWEPDASVPSLQAVVDGGKHIHQRNAGACMPTDSSLESTVTGISLQGPSALVDTNCVKAMSVTLHQVNKAVPIEKPDAITDTDALGVLHSTGTCCADGGESADIKTFSKSNRTDESGNYAKRKVKDSNGSENQTEDLVNQPRFSQGFSAKRSRAAEIHNKSERKRRERINKKLKVLQELIPNANKTDKASLLGEAIEYLRALQAQIMVMSYRTGFTIPPMLMSHGMLHQYMPPHLGMGFGAGFVRNTSAKDVGVATPTYASRRKTSSLKPLMPLPALPSPARLVGTGNDPSKHLVGYSANYFPMANVGLVRPPYQLQTHAMPVHHKAPSFL